MDREDWYRLRNDRINRVNDVNLGHFVKRSIGVIINPEHLDHYSIQIMSFMSLNMLSRWCPSLTIDLPGEHKCVIPGYSNKTLKQVVLELVQKNDPFGEFNVCSISPADYDIVLNIGECCQKHSSNIIWIDGEGWLGGYGQNRFCNIDVRNKYNNNPVGPTFASCLGVSEVFRRYLGLQNTERFIKWYSIYNFQSDISPAALSNPVLLKLLEVGTIHQIGCGAVGSTLDLLLSFLNVRGNIQLIDYDSVSIPNTASSMLFTAIDGKEKSNKVDICCSVLKKVDGFKPYPHKCDYGTFIKKQELLTDYPDIVLCLANEKNIWSTIQHNYPPLVLHATTSLNWGVNLGRHIPFQDWCIVCRFGVVEYETTPICSLAEIDSEGEEEEILGILPFLSAASAILILSEILRSRSEAYSLTKENFTQFSFKERNADFIRIKMLRKKNCPVCWNQTEEEYSIFLKQVSKNKQ